ncbi:Membrane-bound O-acyltransferase domain-containing protein 2 [Stylophora pistillata]|uniref:Membrane-bound O-acyltransferase domain-containing protein 2 n=1 Tax=Stylophora pistillata TaxID=50429 RepID=A0A2B4SIA1_STYPI|nr:Membrane-bound O-acyltransferase domain-containing protein 2 [Stylophora pistillata]
MRKAGHFLCILSVIIVLVIRGTWTIRHDTFWGEKAPPGCQPCPRSDEGLFDTPICGKNGIAYKNFCYLTLRNCIAKILKKELVSPSSDPKTCGPLMVLVQRITYVAFSVHDGLGRDDSKLTEEQRKCRLQKVPSLLEYFSYLFHYSTILVGPVCTFRDFSDFIDGSDIRSKEPGQKEPSPLFAALRNLMVSTVCIAFVVMTGSNYPITRNGDPDFIRSSPLFWRLLYAWISIVSVRMRYYFAFKLAEAMNNFCGLGFNGFDENGRAKWNRITNVNILKIEFGTSLKEVLDNWNIGTVLWLRKIVYDRVPYHRTRAVFVLSALWHGFYSGYYMAFATCALMVEAARKVRRKYRPLFQGSHVSSRFYDLMTCAVTIFSLTFITVPFVGLEAKFGLEFWRSMYYYGHVWSIVAFLLVSGGKSETVGKEDNKTENMEVRNEEKDKKRNSAKENLTELRNRVNKDMESPNELFCNGTPNNLLKENLIVGS